MLNALAHIYDTVCLHYQGYCTHYILLYET